MKKSGYTVMFPDFFGMELIVSPVVKVTLKRFVILVDKDNNASA